MFAVGPPKMKNTFSTEGVAVATLVVRVLFLLGLLLAAETVEVLAEHVTLLEGVVDLALMIRARLLEHIVE